MRVNKDANETSRIQKAVDISGEAFVNAAVFAGPASTSSRLRQ
jgi:Xaa-Pro aminopeptidase